MYLLFFFTALVVKFGLGVPISCGDSKSGSLGVSGEDYYQFTLPSDGSYTELTFSSCNDPANDTVLTLYTDSMGQNVVNSCDDCGNCSTSSYQEIWVVNVSANGLIAGQSYWIGIRLYSNTSVGAYTLDFSCRINSDSPTMLPTVQPTVLTNMPTSSPIVFTEISCGFSTQAILNAGIWDWYRFILSNGVSYTALHFSTCDDGSSNPSLWLFTEEGNYIAHCNDCGTPSCGTEENWSFNPNTYNLVPDQNYFIGVFSGMNYNYTLQFTCSINSTSPTMSPTTQTYSPSNTPTGITNSPTVFIEPPYASLGQYKENELPTGAETPVDDITRFFPTYFFKPKKFPSGRELAHGIQVVKRSITYEVDENAHDQEPAFDFTYEASTLKFYKTGIYQLSISHAWYGHAAYANGEEINQELPDPLDCVSYPIVRIYNGFGTGQRVSEMLIAEDVDFDAPSFLEVNNPKYISVLFEVTNSENYYVITDKSMEAWHCDLTPWKWYLDIKISYVADL